ncbi:O-antigen ligase family protein [Roseimicrobium gellanilyticum]|nr:O-antigen ligase family protein [Roseimicrobium gellanilyticum]
MPGIIGMGIVTPVMILAMATMVVRARNLNRPLKFIVTPQDWAMLAYYAFIVWTSPDPTGALKGAFPLFAFYFVTVQALDTPGRLHKYMKYWLAALVVLAAFGVGSLYGWDITGAAGMTAANKGRLAIGTWMHNNPNALGHSVILVLPMSYFLFFWRSSMTNRLIASGLSSLAFHCVMKTESKGAFLAGFIVFVLAYAFGRSKIFQILLVSAAVAGSGAVLSIMPRMAEMGSLKSDEGVQGRLLAWEIARTASRQHLFSGQGWKTFKATIRWEKMSIPKATHSSYVQVGAELGRGGIFLYMGLIWLGLKSLIRCKALDEEGERCRKCLFGLVVAYAISNWMIDRAYHTEFFFFMAGTSAFHRLYLLRKPEEVEEVKTVDQSLRPPVRALQPPIRLIPEFLPPAVAVSGPAFPRMAVSGWAMGHDPTVKRGAEPVESGPRLPRWVLRPTIVDALVAASGTWAVFAFWDYILKTMLY